MLSYSTLPSAFLLSGTLEAPKFKITPRPDPSSLLRVSKRLHPIELETVKPSNSLLIAMMLRRVYYTWNDWKRTKANDFNVKKIWGEVRETAPYSPPLMAFVHLTPNQPVTPVWWKSCKLTTFVHTLSHWHRVAWCCRRAIIYMIYCVLRLDPPWICMSYLSVLA